MCKNDAGVYICVKCKAAGYLDTQALSFSSHSGLCRTCYDAMPQANPRNYVFTSAIEQAFVEAYDKSQDTDWAGLPPPEMPSEGDTDV